MGITTEIVAKRSIVHQVNVAKDSMDKEKHKEKVREAANKCERNSQTGKHKVDTSVKASSWKEVAAAAGITLVEAGEHIEKEEITKIGFNPRNSEEHHVDEA